jgi:outer membrane protein OmpA-like peptidoglycan-associated protein
MKIFKTKLRFTLLLLGGMMFFASSLSASPNAPDASVTFEIISVSVGVGGSLGKGTLNYKGYKIPFKMSGFTIGEAGIAKKEGHGFVYNLSALADFSGEFSSQSGGIAVLSGVGYQRMHNDNDVFVELRSMDLGINIGFGGGSFKMILDETAVKKTLAALNAPIKKEAFKSIYFDLGSDTVREADLPILQELVAELRLGQAFEVLIKGYTDTTGTLENNVELSISRAENVYIALRQLAKESGLQEIPPSRIDLFGLGEAGGPSEQVNQANRRVDVAVGYNVPKDKVYR